MKNFLVKMVKGALIGSGFIVPGISGGALAMVFGVYERLIRFLGNPKENFKENIRYFIPLALGGILGLVFFAGIVSYILTSLGDIVKWFFVGAIAGTLPSLWKEAGKKGRGRTDYILLALGLVLGLIILGQGAGVVQGGFQPSFLTWFICGVLIALGILIPGLSSSNFIVYMGLYKQMSDGFAAFDLGVIIPIGLGGLTAVVLLVKLINKIYENYYSLFFHLIIGIVLASTLMIVQLETLTAGLNTVLVSLALFLLGLGLSQWMVRLEDSQGGEKNV